jgi:predicted alpha/beta-fold hydrolase
MSPRPPGWRPDEGDFRPLPLLANRHVQTFLGALLPGASCPPQRRFIVRLDDGDALLLYDNWPRTWRPGGPIALLLHGLGGSAASGTPQRMAVKLLRHGARVVRMNMRGAGEGVSLARGVYNACRSADVRAALHALHAISPTSPLWLAGVSLGGGLSLRTAGELHEHPVPNLCRVAAMCPPIDLTSCCELLAQPENRLYEQHFVRVVINEARQRQRHFPDLPPLRLPGPIRQRTFDDYYTAPRCGFADALDYYRQGGIEHLVPRIPIPALILSSRDDPFICVEPYERMRLPANVEVQLAPAGGHVGFVGFTPAGEVRWAERRIVDWLAGREGRS